MHQRAASRSRQTRLGVLVVVGLLFASGSVLAPRASAFEYLDGKIQAHGYFESQVRVINRNFSEEWDTTMWYQIFNLELEFDIAPDGFGPIDLLSGYIRLEGRYDCIYTKGCGMFKSVDVYGNQAKLLPRRLTNSRLLRYTGQIPISHTFASDGTFTYAGQYIAPSGTRDPFGFADTSIGRALSHQPGADTFNEFRPCGSGGEDPRKCAQLAGGSDSLVANNDDPFQGIFGFLDDYRFVQRQGRGGNLNGLPTIIMGPWLPRNEVFGNAALADEVNPFDARTQSKVLHAAVYNVAYDQLFTEIGSKAAIRFAKQNPGASEDEIMEAGVLVALEKAPERALLIANQPNNFGSGAKPFRPIPTAAAAHKFGEYASPRGMWSPSPATRRVLASGKLDKVPLNFSETERAFNMGASQQSEGPLKEAYLDIETFDSRLWLRIGKQQIVWGKTELFRTTDQFNPQDLALASLPSLEESRIALWALRGVFSFYEVGPLEDVRAEIAINFDQIESSDFGTCGEPYTPNPVCAFGVGLISHAVTGAGVIGFDRPPSPWESLSGIEIGGRLEWRWDRFSFALVDFWGYGDFPAIQRISTFERNVDPWTGRPRIYASRGRCLTGTEADCLTQGPTDIRVAVHSDGTDPNSPLIGNDARVAGNGAGYTAGRAIKFIRETPTSRLRLNQGIATIQVVNPDDPDGPLLTVTNEDYDPRNALDSHHANLTIFNFICATTIGFSSLDPTACAQTVFGSTNFPPQVDLPISRVIGRVLAGDTAINQLAAPALAGTILPLVQLSVDSDSGAVNPDTGLPWGALSRETNVPEYADCLDPDAVGVGGVALGCDSNIGAPATLNDVLTAEQEALLGCGPFWGINCDESGIDLLNADQSVLLQSFIGIEGTVAGWRTDQVNRAQPGTLGFFGPAVCTTGDIGGGTTILPGCRTKWKSLAARDRWVNSGFSDYSGLNPNWRGDVDGDPDRIGFNAPLDRAGSPGAPRAIEFVGQTQMPVDPFLGRNKLSIPDEILITGGSPFVLPNTIRNRNFGSGHPFTGQPWASEMAALSWNYMVLLASQSDNWIKILDNEADLNGDFSAPFAYAVADPSAPNKPICSFITPQTCSTVTALFGLAGQSRNIVRAGGNGIYGRRTAQWHSGGDILINFEKRNVLGFSMDFAEDITKTNYSVELTWIEGIPFGNVNEVDNVTYADTYNLTVSVDRPTFINFLNPNRTFFFNAQVFVQYVEGWSKGMGGGGPWSFLGTFAVQTGFFQDRLLPSIVFVYDVKTNSGAVLPQVNYRFTENFSAAVGAAVFMGRTRLSDAAINPIAPEGQRVGPHMFQNAGDAGLGVIRDRDELFLRLRYTF